MNRNKQYLLFEAIGLVDEDWILEAETAGRKPAVVNKRRAFSSKVTWYGIAAGFVLLLSLYVFQVLNDHVLLPNEISPPVSQSNLSNGSETSSTEQIENNLESSAESIERIPTWEEQTMPERFPEMSYDGVQYWVRSTSLLPEQVGEPVADITASGYDVYTETSHTTDAQLFILDGISPSVALAVQYAGDDHFYPCISDAYFPETLGDLVNDMNLRENMSFNRIYYDASNESAYISRVYTLPDPSVIWDFLFSDLSLKNEGDAHYQVNQIDISVAIPVLGIQNLSLGVNSDNYMQTNITGVASSFYIGPERAEAFIAYVLENGILESEESISYTDPEPGSEEGAAALEEPVAESVSEAVSHPASSGTTEDAGSPAKPAGTEGQSSASRPPAA